MSLASPVSLSRFPNSLFMDAKDRGAAVDLLDPRHQPVPPPLREGPADDEEADRADGGRDREAKDEATERERGIHEVSFRG